MFRSVAVAEFFHTGKGEYFWKVALNRGREVFVFSGLQSESLRSKREPGSADGNMELLTIDGQFLY